MRRATLSAVVAGLALAQSALAEEPPKPLDLGIVEKARVRLVIVDVVVLDGDRRTVPGLTADDFEVIANGKEVPVASLDVECPAGGAEDPASSYRAGDAIGRAAPPAARRIVLAFDYQHLAPMQRTEVLERAKDFVEDGMSADDRVMVAALTGGLRIEQPFQADRQRTLRTLHRMEYDLTLWNGDFSHSIGFNDDDPVEDKMKSFTVLVRRAGLRAYAFPVRPTAQDSWEALLAVSFSVPLAGTEGKATERDFGAVLQSGTSVVHRFHRRIHLEPNDASVTSEPLVTFLEKVSLRPGTYTVTAVLADPAVVDPHAAKVRIEIPAIPTREAFLVGPILGRRAGADLVVRSAGSSSTTGERVGGADAIGDWNSFQPLLVQQVDAPAELLMLTEACVIGKARKDGPYSVARSLRSADGRVIGAFEPAAIEFEGTENIRCQNFLDVLPARAVVRPGDYLFEASFEPRPWEGQEQREVRFSVGATRTGQAPRAGSAE